MLTTLAAGMRGARTSSLLLRAAAAGSPACRSTPLTAVGTGHHPNQLNFSISSFASSPGAVNAALDLGGAGALSTPTRGFASEAIASEAGGGRVGGVNPDTLFRGKQRSLEVVSSSSEKQGGTWSFRRLALQLGGYYSKASTTQRASDRLYASITAQAESHALLDAFGIENSFRGTHSMLCLHVWLVITRLRGEGAKGKELSQAMYDGFQDDVETRVHAEGVKIRVSKHLISLEQSFYGSSIAYDKALPGAPGVLAEALYRNLFMGEGDKGGSRVLERYVRRELGCLDLTKGAALLEGRIRFTGVKDLGN